jgi:hypothetical protein
LITKHSNSSAQLKPPPVSNCPSGVDVSANCKADGSHSESEDGSDFRRVGASFHDEAKTVRESPHSGIIRESVGDDRFEFLLARDFDQAPEQFRTEPEMLSAVCHKNCDLAFLTIPQASQAANGEDFGLFGGRIHIFGDQRHLAVIVDEALSHQALVRDA